MDTSELKFTTEQILNILTKDEENLADLKEFLKEYDGSVPYLAYSLVVNPRDSVKWMVSPGIDYKKLNSQLMKIKESITTKDEVTANA